MFEYLEMYLFFLVHPIRVQHLLNQQLFLFFYLQYQSPEEAELVTFFSDCRPSKLHFFNNYTDLNSEVGIEFEIQISDDKIVFGHQVHHCRIPDLIESLKRCPATVSDLTTHKDATKPGKFF